MTQPEPFTFSVVGTPRPQPRGRHVKGRVVSTANPKAKLWRAAVERIVRQAVADRGDPTPLFAGPVRVRLIFTFKPPPGKEARIGTPHTHKPDAENCAKPPLDIMERCGIYRNDSQASAAPPEKWWGAVPGLSVVVESMEGETRVDPVAWVRSSPDWLSQKA